MASFAQYQQPIGSNAHEFNYPAFTWESDPSYLQTTDESSFTMGYPQQAYNQDLNEPYPFNPEQLAELAKYDTSQQHSQFQPEYTYDQQPPVLSSTSDSGASVQSAMSSNMGSPNTQPQQANEWQQQFNMFPSIYQQDGGIPTSIFETGTIPGESKIGCVGEFSKVSSSHDFSFLQPNTREVTSQPWAETQAGASDARARDSHSVYESSTPFAISGQPFQPRSPVLERVKGRRYASTVSSPQRMPAATRLARSSSANAGATERSPYAPRSPAQSPFFFQSSGHFVPPLGSSCPYPFFQFLFSLYITWRRKDEHMLTE